MYLLGAIKAVDVMYSILPQHLHDRYSKHVKDKICERQMVQICPITGKIIKAYLPITVHAVKDWNFKYLSKNPLFALRVLFVCAFL